ncbi:MAG TPA: hypothetical protein VH253_18805 [Phycisphaerae bacterium]|nr:hypothetical protein [Phycisphaerae bacterium]
MRRRMMLLAAACAAATLGAAPGTVTQPATTRAAEAAWKTVLRELGSEDFAQRQAGQKELEKATWRDRQTLKALANAATDAEVKDRLTARVEELDEEALTNPPPISLDIKDASFSDMVRALGQALDLPLQAVQNGGQSYTLHAVDKPFGEVYLDLQKQGQLGMQASFDGRRIMATSSALKNGVVAGPFVVCPESVTYQRTVDFQADAPAGGAAGGAGGASPTLTLRLAVVADPRLRIVSYAPIEWKSIVDIGDHELLKNAPPRGGQTTIPGRQWQIDFSVPLDPVGMARRIASARGVLHFTVEAARQTVEVADMEKQGNTPIDLGDQQITWTSFVLRNGSVNFQAQVQPRGAPQPGRPFDTSGVTVRLEDANGKQLVDETMRGGFGGGFGGSYVAPIKGFFSVTTKTKDLAVPFELRDLPLP